MTKYNTINRYLFVFMAIILLAASMLFGAKANLKLHAEEEITDLSGTTWQITTGDIKFDQVETGTNGRISLGATIGFTIDETLRELNNSGSIRFMFYVSNGNVVNIVWNIVDNTGNGGGGYYTNNDEAFTVVDGYYVVPAASFIDTMNGKLLGGIKLTFDGTGDTTNAFLIDWLQTNATLVPAQEPSTGVVENISLSVVMIISLVAVLTITTILNKKSKVIR